MGRATHPALLIGAALAAAQTGLVMGERVKAIG